MMILIFVLMNSAFSQDDIGVVRRGQPSVQKPVTSGLPSTTARPAPTTARPTPVTARPATAPGNPGIASSAAPVSSQPQTKPATRAGTLDFEADVIEGERARPDIFIQLGTGAQSMGSAIYSREDFNDFHSVDRLQRPGFIDIGVKK